jgi:hypothetical protein
MMFRRGSLTFKRGVDRLFDQIDQFTIHQAMFAIGALWASKALGKGIGPDDVFTIDSFAFPLSLDIPLAGVTEAAFAERQVESRTIVIQAGQKAKADMPFSQGFNSVAWLPITPIFVDFYERVRPWMEQNHKGQNSWPPTLHFMRLIRNAISHGGRLYMTHDPRAGCRVAPSQIRLLG